MKRSSVTGGYRSAWQRWRRFARRAAEVQSEALLFILFVLLLPAAAARKLWVGSRPAQPGGWRSRPQGELGIEAARRQF